MADVRKTEILRARAIFVNTGKDGEPHRRPGDVLFGRFRPARQPSLDFS